MIEHIYSLGAKFQTTASFFILLDTKSGSSFYVLEKYLQNIIGVCVGGSKVFKMRDV